MGLFIKNFNDKRFYSLQKWNFHLITLLTLHPSLGGLVPIPMGKHSNQSFFAGGLPTLSYTISDSDINIFGVGVATVLVAILINFSFSVVFDSVLTGQCITYRWYNK